jgi:hypothetical protein
MVNDWPPKALGLVPALLALLPVARWPWLDRPARWQTVVLLLVLAFVCFMTLPASRALWEVLPLLEYVQFPWRFLGPAVLCAALLGAAGVSPIRGRAPRAVIAASTAGPAVLVVALWLASLGWFHPRYCNTPRDTTVAGMIAWERATDTIGTTAKGEYLPIWVRRLTPQVQLDEAYARGAGVVPRLDASALPPGAQIISASYGPIRGDIELETPEAFTARYLTLYYPGWQARVAGELTPVSPTDPEGLLSFRVPAGRHRIEVQFRGTPVRVLGNAISMAAAALLAGMTVLPWVARARKGQGMPR